MKLILFFRFVIVPEKTYGAAIWAQETIIFLGFLKRNLKATSMDFSKETSKEPIILSSFLEFLKGSSKQFYQIAERKPQNSLIEFLKSNLKQNHNLEQFPCISHCRQVQVPLELTLTPKMGDPRNIRLWPIRNAIMALVLCIQDSLFLWRGQSPLNTIFLFRRIH